MRTGIIIRGLCSSILISLGACAAGTDAGAVDDEGVAAVSAEQHLLAEVDLEGGHARFVAIDPDELWIMTDTVDAPSPLRDPAIRRLNFAEIYEYWSGKPAPTELVEHARRVPPLDSALEQEVADSETGGRVAVTAAPIVVTAEALSAIDFQIGYCSGMEYCWTDKGGTWEHEARARYWLGHVNAVQGDMTIQMRRRAAIGGWENVWSTSLISGHLYASIGATSDVINKRPLKFKIFDADGDDWHVAAHWD